MSGRHNPNKKSWFKPRPKSRKPEDGKDVRPQEVDIARPSGPELNILYKKLLEDLAIPEAKRQLMLSNESDDRKWQLITAHSNMLRNTQQQDHQDKTREPKYWVEVITRRNRKDEPVLSVSDAGGLYAVLRTAHRKFLLEFIRLDGVEALVEITRWYTARDEMTEGERKVLAQIISSYKALMNNRFGMEAVLCIPDSISAFALGMDLTDESHLGTAQEVIMLLAVTCFYSSEGRDMVVIAMDHLRQRWREKQMFSTLVDVFDNCGDNEFRAATSMFITTIVNSASEVEERVRVRNAFLALDIMRVFDRVLEEARDMDDESYAVISTQVQVFEDMMAEDHREVVFRLRNGAGEDDDLDLSDQNDIFEYLQKSAMASGCSDLLLELSHALLLIPHERALAEPTWHAVKEFAKEATDYTKRSGNAKRIRLNYQSLSELLDLRNELDEKLSQVSSGDDIIGLQRKKIKDLQQKLEKARQAGGKASIRAEEKASSDEVNILQEQVQKLREQITKLQHQLELTRKGKPIEDDIVDSSTTAKSGGAVKYSGKLDSTGLAPAGLVPGVKSVGIPPCPLKDMPGSLELAPIPAVTGAKTVGAPSRSGGGGGAPTAKNPMMAAAAAAAAKKNGGKPNMKAAGIKISNLRSAVSAATPPGAVMAAKEREEAIRKKLGLKNKPAIQPSVKMRNIFWTTVPVEKLEGTIWPELSDQNVKFNTKKLEKMFGVDPQVAAAAAKMKGKRKSTGQVHLVTGNRQQNIGIALSKMRATDEELATAIMQMDETLLTPNHTALLLSCVPTDDEVELIKQFEATNGDPKKLAREDRFLRVMSNIPNLHSRLRALQTQYTFDESYERVYSKMIMVQKACAEIDRSTRLHKIMEIVLAIGNYINGGTPRGAAWGFKIDALNKLETIKDHSHKKSLMDFLYAVLEENYPELLKLDLPASAAAAEINLSETMTELNQLASAVRSIRNELEKSKEKGAKKDRFVNIMTGFEVKASKHLSELQTDFERVRGEFHRIVSLYAESGSSIEPESFFIKFVRFNASLQRAKRAVEEQREREKRAIRLAEEKQRMKTLKRMKQLEASGADEGVFAQFAKANAGNAQDIVKGFLQRNRSAMPSMNQGTSSRSLTRSDTMKSDKSRTKKKDIKIIRVVGPDGQIIEKRMKKKKKKKKTVHSSAPSARDYEIA